MRRFPSVRSRVPLLLTALLPMLSLFAGPAAADPVPPAVAALLPSGTTLAAGDWGVFDTEFGKTFVGDLTAKIPGRPFSCDSTQGPDLRLSIKGDTAWEEPPMLDMAVELYEASIADAKTSLPDRARNLRSSNSSIQSTTEVKVEKLPNGTLVYFEQVEECARHKGGNTVLRGFARRGATTLEIDLFVTAAPADAVVLAKDALARFEKLDLKPLLK